MFPQLIKAAEGVVKTHRLQLHHAASLLVPNAPDPIQQSRLSISAKALKDLLEHFPIARGPKSDPQLVWSFGDDEVILRGLESSMDASGMSILPLRTRH